MLITITQSNMIDFEEEKFKKNIIKKQFRSQNQFHVVDKKYQIKTNKRTDNPVCRRRYEI